MEKKKVNKKLSLNKDVVANLNDSDMNQLKGGMLAIRQPTNSLCIDWTCVGTCYGSCFEDTCGFC